MSMEYIGIQHICIRISKNIVIHVYKGENQRKAQLLIKGQMFSANEIENDFKQKSKLTCLTTLCSQKNAAK